MSLERSVELLSRVSQTAIILSLGATPEEVPAVLSRLYPMEIPIDERAIIVQVQDAIEYVRAAQEADQ